MKTFIAGAPFDRIAMDILDTHKIMRHRNRYFLVISDYFTKYTDAIPLRRYTAKNVANALMTKWIAYHGVPSEILSDQGAEFEGQLFKIQENTYFALSPSNGWSGGTFQQDAPQYVEGLRIRQW